MSRVGRRTLVSALLIAGITAVVTTGLAQGFEDPRNNDPQYYDAINGASCYAHHEAEGFVAMGFGFEQRYSQLPIGEQVPIKVSVRHTSDITQTIQAISVVVNTSKAPNVMVISNETIPNFNETLSQDLNAGDPAFARPFTVLDGASEVYVSARLTSEPTGSDLPIHQGLPPELKGTFTVKAGPNENRQTVAGPDPYNRVFRAEGDEITQLGTGGWVVEAGWDSDVDPTMTVEIFIAVNYTSDQTEFTFRIDDALAFKGAKATIEIPVIIQSDEEAVLDFRVQSVSYWPHNPSDGAPRDDGLYYRFMTMKLRGGDSIVSVSGANAPTPVAPAVDLYNLFARLIGFIALFLVPVSMVTGGLFGKSSRRWLNKMTGGAKKRVLWHSAMSFIIIGVASLHFVLSLLEAKFVWTKGLLWGGVGWALLISLGFTGYYQVRMIKRWNYRVWRHTHLWSAVGVFGFGIIHMALDGSDLQVVRDALPWLNKLIWP